MNFSFLPEKIKKQLAETVANKIPISIARSSASIEGKPGEGYVVGYEDRLLMFSRELGEHDYSNITADFGSVGKLNVKKDGINTFFDVEIDGKHYSMKFSSFEEQNLKSIMDAFSSRGKSVKDTGRRTAAQNTIPSEQEAVQDKERFSSRIGLASALMYVASVDDDISKAEDLYIRVVLGDNKSLLAYGLKYYKTHTFEQLLEDLSGISTEEKLCFLSNMMELGMRDGTLHSSELNMIRKFSNFMDISEDEYNTIKQVLLIKNKISVLST